MSSWRPFPQLAHTNQEGTNVITIDTENRCGICDHPHENHSIRYAAVAGDHTWRPAIWAGPASQTPVPHPDDGVTIAVDPSGGGGCLPARDVAEWIERTDPAPVEAPPLPPAPEKCYPIGAVNLPVEYARPSFIDRIRNARKAKP